MMSRPLVMRTRDWALLSRLRRADESVTQVSAMTLVIKYRFFQCVHVLASQHIQDTPRTASA